LGASATWAASVSSTTFSTGGGSAPETIGVERVSYWSGPPTDTRGLALNACTPGQALAAQAETLDQTRTAFRCTGTSLLAGTSLSWNPTIAISLPDTAVAGSYTGTITHSVV